MADNISELSATAASNTTIDGTDVSGATGKVKDGDNVMRSLASFMALFYDDLGAQNTVGGTANAITVTTSTLYTALASGMVIVFKAGSSNTGATTLNLDAIGAKAVRKIVGGSDVALGAGDILSGRYYTMIYSSAANSAAGGWIIIPAAQYLPDGTAIDPALTFDNDLNTGMYRIGSDNIGIALGGAKALDVSAGSLDIPGTASGASSVVLHEDTDNGTNKVTVKAPASLSADATVTLPGTTGTLALKAEKAAVLRIQTFTASGTYTPNANMLYCELNCVGGGGGGGGSHGVTGLLGAAQGGGSGSWSTKLASASDIGASQTVTIGSAGSGGSSGLNDGSNGGDTSIGTLCVGKGGTGGSGVTPGTTVPSKGQGGVAGSGDIARVGQHGTYAGYTTSSAGAPSGSYGGSSPFGGGGNMAFTLTSTTGVTGNGGNGYGSGGSGGFSSGAADAAGGNGAAGFAYVIEYCSQ